MFSDQADKVIQQLTIGPAVLHSYEIVDIFKQIKQGLEPLLKCEHKTILSQV